MLTSLVPFDRLTVRPAVLTPDEAQPVIRLLLHFYRRCKRNHLLCSSYCPFGASSNGSFAFSSPRSYLNRFISALLVLVAHHISGFLKTQHKAV